MSDSLSNHILILDRKFLLISVLLFFSGVLSSILVVKKELRLLLRYPVWMWKQLKKFLLRQPSFAQLFLLIFLFNALSLFVNVISGLSVVLPYLFCFFVGLNVGVIGYKEGGAQALLLMFFSPHVLFELPAAWFSTTLGMQLGKAVCKGISVSAPVFKQSFIFYFQIIVPLLLIAGLIESALISHHIKLSKHAASFSDKPLHGQQDNYPNQQH